MITHLQKRLKPGLSSSFSSMSENGARLVHVYSRDLYITTELWLQPHDYEISEQLHSTWIISAVIVLTNNGPTTASFLVYHSQVPSLQNENGNILENKAIVVAA